MKKPEPNRLSARWIPIFAIVCLFCWSPTLLSAQVDDDEIAPHEIQFSEPEEHIWEIGMRLTSNGGNVSGIVATVPIPMVWPEQKIELIEEIKTNNVGKITYKDLTREATTMMFKVNRLADGEKAEAILRYRVLKSHILPPMDTTDLQFAKSIKGNTKSFLKPSPFIESKDKRIREIAKQLKKANGDKPAWEQVEAIYSWVRENIRYEFDTVNRSCLTALEAGHGDCGEMSGLFIAICRASGIPARAVWVPGHFYPEFYLADAEGNGHWFPCQAAGSQHEFGEIAEARPILQKGDRFKLVGDPEVKGFVQPTAFGKDDPFQALQIDEWILREVAAEETAGDSESAGDSGSAGNIGGK